MKFYVDTVAPQITKKEIREEGGKTYIDISISDNRYVMGAVVNGKNADGINFEKSAYTKAAQTGDVSIDVTGLDISTLKITALDYAYNQTEVSAIPEQCAKITAIYRDGIMQSVNAQKVPRSEVTDTPDIINPDGTTTSVFYWDSLAGMKPIFEAYSPSL